ncbi:endolytic transglycosylase MltG [Streptomyces sp. NPDC059650]|uniref:endolytic transglycosylase MltG n=1 Tax=Streptomyces sp. NPDC059650 TaxID=3346896 RepID=UPI0036939A40
MPYGGPQQQYPQEPQYQQQYAQHQQGTYPDQMQGYPAPQQDQQQMHPHGPQHAHAHGHPQQQQQQTYGGQPWDTGQGQYAMADPQAQQATQAYPEPEPQAHDAYPAADPYAGAEPYAQQPAGGYPGEAPDTYGTEESYPPPEPPGRRRPAPDPEAEPEGDEDDEDEDTASGADAGRGGRRGGRSKGKGKGKGKGKDKPKRSGAACLVASLVIVGLIGGGGYYGYNYLKARFGAAEDYTGEGTSESVEVQIPNGAGLMAMGRILKEHGVVASTEAFVAAATANTKGTSIQPGVYTLKKKMSAAAAVKVMIDPAKLNVLTIPEGKRAVEIYKAIDERLHLKEGTTKEIALKEAKNLGLPEWANNNKDIKDPLEGFLYPARYDISKDATPQTLLKQMVAQSNEAYAKADVKAQATKLGLANPLQLVTVASLVQAEGKYQHDFDKISRVVYNRLKPNNTETNGLLDFDSTVNYIKGQSTLDVGAVNDLRKIDDPYNTYRIKGLPAGPIGNPGPEALKSAINPVSGPWYYFVSVNENETLFAVTNDEHNRNRQRYEEERKKTRQ